MYIMALGDHFTPVLYLDEVPEEYCISLAGDVCPPEVHFPSVRNHRLDLLKIMERYSTISNLRFVIFDRLGWDLPENNIGFFIDVFPGTTLFDLGYLINEFEELLGVPVGIAARLKIMPPSRLLRKYRSELLKVMERHPSLSNLRVLGSVARGEDPLDCELYFWVDFVGEDASDSFFVLRDEFEKILGIRVSIHMFLPQLNYRSLVLLNDL